MSQDPRSQLTQDITSKLRDRLNQAVRQSRGESTSQDHGGTTQLSYLNDTDPSLAREQAKTEDIKTDTRLKKTFAITLLIVLGLQLFLMNVIFIFIGMGVFKFENFVINLFMGGTLAEVFGVVFIMTRYLFSKHE